MRRDGGACGPVRAALIYQHTAMERDRAIADALGKLAEEALKKQDPSGSGTQRARKID